MSIAILLTYLVAAIAFWSHPTNDLADLQVEMKWEQPVAGTADAYPARDGHCVIRVSPEAWAAIDEEARQYTMRHEVGHCLGLWEPGTFHLGDGVMGGVDQMVAFDQFRIDAMHSNGVVPRVFVPMVSH